MDGFTGSIWPLIWPWLKFGMYVFIILLVTIIGIWIIIEKRRRKWKVEVHEQKADGRIHTVGYDKLIEKKLNMGTKTIYWLKKAKHETIPPPDITVDRFKGKEEIDYLRIERDMLPVSKSMSEDYHNKNINLAVSEVYDNIREKIRSIKTTFFNSDSVRDRWMYIPINKTLTATMIFKPIDFDMSMMAMNEIHNADEFFQSKYEFWKKYGSVIVFGVTIIFLIILIVLTFEYVNGIVSQIMSKSDQSANLLKDIAEKLVGGKPPS